MHKPNTQTPFEVVCLILSLFRFFTSWSKPGNSENIEHNVLSLHLHVICIQLSIGRHYNCIYSQIQLNLITVSQFANDTTVVGLINDETAYKAEVRDLAGWCQNNNLSLNVTKTKEMIVDYRKMRTEHSPILIDGAVVEQVESFKFLGVHINNKLDWSNHKDSREKGTTKPIPPHETKNIWHGS